MIERLRNLMALSKYSPKETADGAELKVTLQDNAKPKGMATIIQDDNVDLFKND